MNHHIFEPGSSSALPDKALSAFALPTLSEGSVKALSAAPVVLDPARGNPGLFAVPVSKPRLGERLFDATAEAKVWTSKVAMHLDRATRDRFFKQLDRLHDEDEWFGEDRPVNLESYKSFIRAVVGCGIDGRPSIALMPSGNLLAMWETGSARLSVEFLPNNRAKWLTSRPFKGDVERAAGETSVERLGAVLAPYDASRLFIAA